MKKVFMLALVGIVLSVASYGVYKTQSSEETMSDFMLANIEALTSIEIPNIEYPKDPFEGEGDKYFKRSVDNYCEYDIFFHSNFLGVDYYYVYLLPITEVSCEGWGIVPCIENVYLGQTHFAGILSTDEMRSLGIYL